MTEHRKARAEDSCPVIPVPEGWQEGDQRRYCTALRRALEELYRRTGSLRRETEALRQKLVERTEERTEEGTGEEE